ncbi:MAG: SIS domain-containing protein [Verrucomicrobiota bacterium]
MSENFPFNYFSTLSHSLRDLEICDIESAKINSSEGFDRLCELSTDIALRDAQQFMVGNGASAAMANHMCLDWTKNAKVRTRSFANAPLLTAMGNDLGFEHAMSEPLSWYAHPGDLLVTISSSGSSPNIINAIKMARKLKMTVITLSGLNPENPSRSLGDLNIYVSAKTYGMVECAHQVIMHCWLDQYMQIKEWETSSPQNMRETRSDA